MSDSAVTPKEFPVDWEALEDAFENNAPEVHSYLHLVSGEVLRVVDGIADPGMHSRIASDATYLRIEPVSSREQYRWMERFIPMVEDAEVQQRLIQAIDGKGAFRRFKDVLMSFATERERWFAFRSERLRVFMEAWLSTHHLIPVPRVAPAPAAEGADVVPPHPPEDAEAKRHRLLDAQRRQVMEIIEQLPGREVDKILAFAEFVSARFLSRARLSSVPPPPSHEPGSEG